MYSHKHRFAKVALCTAVLMLTLAGLTFAAPASDLAQAWAIIQSKQFVDLTHSFGPGIAHWKGFPDEKVEVLYTYKKDGFMAQSFTHVGQWGTHVDPPAHFQEGGRFVDQISLKEMILPLVVIDIHTQVADNPDYVVTMSDVRDWELQHGKIPAGAFVALRTDWSKRWVGGLDAMLNADKNGVCHYPGWSMEVLKYLYEDCQITASGHETTDTDPGLVTTKDEYPLETYILTHDHYQIELLDNLDLVPESGALVVAAFPKAKNGTGFPARVFAILP